MFNYIIIAVKLIASGNETSLVRWLLHSAKGLKSNTISFLPYIIN